MGLRKAGFVRILETWMCLFSRHFERYVFELFNECSLLRLAPLDRPEGGARGILLFKDQSMARGQNPKDDKYSRASPLGRDRKAIKSGLEGIGFLSVILISDCWNNL